MRALLATLFAFSSPLLASLPLGTPGHIKVELQTPKGWLELYQPAYQLQQSRRTLTLPSDMAQKGRLTLRLSAIDNDETQIDYLNVDGGKLLSAKDLASGQDLMKKLNAADRDVAEIHGHPLQAVLQAPKDGGDLRLVLEARSSDNANIPNRPFRLGAGSLKGAARNAEGPMVLSATDGSRLQIDTGVLATGSGHPSAPLLGELKVSGGRLKGHLDFGTDNDPGDDDYAAIVAYDAQDQATEFKVTPADERYGKASWAYAPAPSVAWQHMVFDLDVPLAQVPRSRDGKLSLELLAYGTCSGVGTHADFKAGSISGSGVAIPDNLTWTVNAVVNIGSGPFTGNPGLSVTTKVFDPSGITVSTQVQTASIDQYSCSTTFPYTFYFNPTCSGSYTLWADAQGTTADPDLTNAPATLAVAVSGGSPCATPTSTPTPAPGPANAGAPAVALTAPKQGEAMVIAFPSLPASAKAVIFNSAGEHVADVDSAGGNLLWSTVNIAPGIYFLHITAALSDGSNIDTWKKGWVASK